MPSQDPDVIHKPSDQILVLAYFAFHCEHTLSSDLGARDLDLELMLFTEIGFGLSGHVSMDYWISGMDTPQWE